MKNNNVFQFTSAKLKTSKSLNNQGYEKIVGSNSVTKLLNKSDKSYISTPKNIIEESQKLFIEILENRYGKNINIKNKFMWLLDEHGFCFDSHIEQESENLIETIYSLNSQGEDIFREIMLRFEITLTLKEIQNKKFNFEELNLNLREINKYKKKKVKIHENYNLNQLDRLLKIFGKDSYSKDEIYEYNICVFIDKFPELIQDHCLKKSNIDILLDYFKIFPYNEVVNKVNNQYSQLQEIFLEAQNISLQNINNIIKNMKITQREPEIIKMRKVLEDSFIDGDLETTEKNQTSKFRHTIALATSLIIGGSVGTSLTMKSNQAVEQGLQQAKENTTTILNTPTEQCDKNYIINQNLK